MLRKVFSLPWQSLSLLKLREELSVRGLKRLSSKEEMIKTLARYESIKPALSSIPENYSALDNPVHRHLPTSYIIEEIFKRDPSFEIKANVSKADLIASLKTILIDERASMPKDLRNLIKLSETPESLNLKEVIWVLDQIRDTTRITDRNFNVLMHTEENSLTKIWEFLFNNVRSLDFTQISSLVQAASVLRNVFKKNFFPGESKLSQGFVEGLLSQACETCEASGVSGVSGVSGISEISEASEISETRGNVSSSDIASLLSAFKSLAEIKELDSVSSLQGKMIARFDLADVIDDMSLVHIISNLPSGCNSTYSSKIEEIEAKVQPLLNSLSYEQLIDVIFGLHRSGRKISFQLSKHVDNLLTDGLKKVSSSHLKDFTEVLISQRLISEVFAGNLLNALFLMSSYDTESCEKIIDYTYLFYENNLSHLILSKFRPFTKIGNSDCEFSLNSNLKYGIVYWSHCTETSFMVKVLLSIVKNAEKSEEISKNFDLILKLQKNLLDDEREKPIFNYQFNSFELLNQELRDRCIHALNGVIKTHEPSNALVFQYYSEYENAKPPEDSDVLAKASASNFNKLCKTVWRFNCAHLAPEVLHQSRDFLDLNESDPTEGLFYLTSSNPLLTSKISPLWTVKGTYYPALCYNLAVPFKPDNFCFQSLNEKLSLFGEALIKTLIKFSESDPNSNIFRLTSSLNFTPKSHPALKADLISRFFNQMQKHESRVDFIACSNFLSSKLSGLDKKDLVPLFSFFKDHWVVLKPELQNFFEVNLKTEDLFKVMNQGLSVSSVIKMMKERDDAEIGYDNVYLLDVLTQYKVYNDKLVKGYVDLAPSVPQHQALVIISKLLELFSITSCRKSHFEQVHSVLAKLNLWALLSFEDTVNYFFNYHHLKIPGLELPGQFEEDFKFNLVKLDNLEMLVVNPELKLNYYRPFKYETELEPRSIVSNNQERKEVNAEVTVDIKIPEVEVVKKLKKYSMFLHYGIIPSDEVKRVVKYFYQGKEKNLIIKSVKSELLEIIKNDLGYKAYSKDATSHESQNVLWNYDVGFTMSKQVYIILSNSELCHMSDGSVLAISLINKVIKTQIQEKLNLNVAIILTDAWNKYDLDQKVSIAQLVGQNLI